MLDITNCTWIHIQVQTHNAVHCPIQQLRDTYSGFDTAPTLSPLLSLTNTVRVPPRPSIVFILLLPCPHRRPTGSAARARHAARDSSESSSPPSLPRRNLWSTVISPRPHRRSRRVRHASHSGAAPFRTLSYPPAHAASFQLSVCPCRARCAPQPCFQTYSCLCSLTASEWPIHRSFTSRTPARVCYGKSNE
jgi:hypothetical protein